MGMGMNICISGYGCYYLIYGYPCLGFSCACASHKLQQLWIVLPIIPVVMGELPPALMGSIWVLTLEVHLEETLNTLSDGAEVGKTQTLHRGLGQDPNPACTHYPLIPVPIPARSQWVWVPTNTRTHTRWVPTPVKQLHVVNKQKRESSALFWHAICHSLFRRAVAAVTMNPEYCIQKKRQNRLDSFSFVIMFVNATFTRRRRIPQSFLLMLWFASWHCGNTLSTISWHALETSIQAREAQIFC